MERAGDLLKKYFQNFDISRGNMYADFFNGWEAIVGKKFSHHSRILDIKGKVLIVEVDHPATLQMIMMHKQKILSRVNRKYPELELKSIKFRVKFERTPDPPAPPSESKPEKQDVVQNEEDIKKVESEELKKMLGKLYNSVLNKQMRVDKNK